LNTFFFQPNAAPGREGAAPTQPSQPVPSNAPSGGPPPAGPGGFFGGGGMMLFLLLPILLMFMMTRSQSKKQKQLEASLKVGDRVLTQSGLIGRIIELGDRTAKIEIAPGVNVQMVKTAIQGQDPGDKAAADAKAKDAIKDKPQEKKA
jgi:preprotein translocase subunit YajC